MGKKVAIKKGGYVKCTGVAYFHGAPFDAVGLIGTVVRAADGLVHFDTESRGEVYADKGNVEGISKKEALGE